MSWIRRHPVVRVIGLIALTYFGLILALALFQRSYIYYPQRANEARLLEEAAKRGWEQWLDGNGEHQGWTVERDTGEGTLIVFHGNAGHAFHRDYWVRAFNLRGADDLTFARIHLFEYPGYGLRDGRPGERVIQEAAERALAQVLAAKPGPVFLLGESLGSGIATYLAERHPEDIEGLILVTPFTRLSDVGRAHFPWAPVRLLLREHYNNNEQLASYPGPVAMVVAGRDAVVPARLGRALHEAHAEQSRLWELPEADHKTLFSHTGPRVWREVLTFARAAAYSWNG